VTRSTLLSMTAPVTSVTRTRYLALAALIVPSVGYQ
jgi:hypothetical protein